MFGAQIAISDDILDIGTRRHEDRKRQAMASGGTGALCPSDLVLGEPAAFDLPNVPDVSSLFLPFVTHFYV